MQTFSLPRLAAGFTLLTLLGLYCPAQAIDVDAEPVTLDRSRDLQGLVITIDPGHGGSSFSEGYSGSARGVNSRLVEGDLNMKVAGALRHMLQRAGASVHMTRWDDRKVSMRADGEPTIRAEELGARTDIAEATASHLFIALHHNSAPRVTADGVVVLIWPTDSEGNEQPLEVELADILREEVEQKVHHTEPFGHYVSDHPLVANSDIPSAVVEFGFLTNPDFDAWVAQPDAHVAEAEGVFNGVVRMWQEHRGDLENLHASLFPEAVRQEGGNENIRWARPQIGRIARSLWPLERPVETTGEADHLINLYRTSFLSDRTFFHLNAHTSREGETWVLSGTVNHPNVREGVAELLEAAGCEPLENRLRMLPDGAVGDERYGVVKIPMALTYNSPQIGEGPETQLLLGERVHLLDVSDDGLFFLHMAGEGYIGWVRADAIRRLDAGEFARWQSSPRATVLRETMIDDFRVPTGARLPILNETRRAVTLEIPQGVRATAGRAQITLPRQVLLMPDTEGEPIGHKVAMTALEYMHVPYVFGGRSALGLDCSGLSGVSYQANGLRLPRDARQQVLVGEIVATPWLLGPMEPGDLVFFCDGTGRVSHEGISLGGLRFVHSAPPRVQIASFDPNDPLYDQGRAERFAFARRPIE
jgi:N-acetylmuramoyl-L-alanine amidase